MNVNGLKLYNVQSMLTQSVAKFWIPRRASAAVFGSKPVGHGRDVPKQAVALIALPSDVRPRGQRTHLEIEVARKSGW